MKINRTQIQAAAIVVAALLAGCAGDSPTGPTPVPVVRPPVPPPPPPPPPPSATMFNDTFWSALVYNQYSKPGELRTRVSWVLSNPTTMNVYLRTDPWPHDYLVRETWVPWIRDHLDGWVSELTGAPWRGRFVTGPERSKRYGWITIRLIDPATEYAGNWAAWCGYAWVGSPTGEIWIDRTRNICINSNWFPELLIHEIGHAFGFYHVSDRNAVMFQVDMKGSRTGPHFNQTEQYHAQLAYEVGRGQSYCGEPFTSSCLPSDSVRPLFRAPQIIVD